MNKLRLTRVKSVKTYAICPRETCFVMEAMVREDKSEEQGAQMTTWCRQCQTTYDSRRPQALMRLVVEIYYDKHWPGKNQRETFHPESDCCRMDQKQLVHFFQCAGLVYPGYVPSYYTTWETCQIQTLMSLWLNKRLPIDIRAEAKSGVGPLTTNMEIESVLSVNSIFAIDPEYLIGFPAGLDKRTVLQEMEDVEKSRDPGWRLHTWEVISCFGGSSRLPEHREREKPLLFRTTIGTLAYSDIKSLDQGHWLTERLIIALINFYEGTMLSSKQQHRILIMGPRKLRDCWSGYHDTRVKPHFLQRPLWLYAILPLRQVLSINGWKTVEWSCLIYQTNGNKCTHYCRSNRINKEEADRITTMLAECSEDPKRFVYETKAVWKFEGDANDSGLMVVDLAKWMLEATTPEGAWNPGEMPRMNYRVPGYRRLLQQMIQAHMVLVED